MNRLCRFAASNNVRVPTRCLALAGAPFALYAIVESKAAAPLAFRACGAANSTTPNPFVTVHAAGRGKPHLNLQDGRETGVEYRGDCDLTNALQEGSARPRALASADFDHNGTPDVVAGYAANGAGLVTLRSPCWRISLSSECFAPEAS